METKKICKTCNELKDFSNFYPDKTMKTGCINFCKSCESIKRSKRWNLNRDKYLIAKRAYAKSNRARALKKQWNATDKGKAWVKKNTLIFRSKNPIKYKAHSIVNAAILNGKLNKKPCEICGTFKYVHAHHDDYTKPLEVIFLCAKHHYERHIYLKKINHDFKGDQNGREKT